MKEDDVLLTLPQVATALGVSHVTAWRIVVKEERMPKQRIGNSWAVWQSEVDKYLAAPPNRPDPGRPRKPPH